MKPTDIDLDFLVKGVELPAPDSDRTNGHLPKDRQLADDDRAMAYDALKMQMLDALRAIFARAKDAEGLTYKDVASRLGVDPAVITRRFQGGQNMSLKTIADMLAAVDGEVEIRGHYLGDLHPVQEAHSIETMTGASLGHRFAGSGAIMLGFSDSLLPIFGTEISHVKAWPTADLAVRRYAAPPRPHSPRNAPLRVAGIAPVALAKRRDTSDTSDDGYLVEA